MKAASGAKDKFKKLDKVREALAAMVVLVEGKRDKSAFETSGFRAVAIIAVSGRNMEKICSELAGKEVAVMTDFDDAGRKLAKRLYESLRSNDAHPDLEQRFWLRRLLGVYTFEQLPSAIEDLRKKMEKER